MRPSQRGRYLILAILCIALAVLCLSFIGCASSKAGKALNVGVGVSAAADLITTRQAINSGRGYEANPAMAFGPWTQGLLKAAGTSAAIGAASIADMKGKRELAQVIRLAVIAFNTAVAVRNHQVGR